MINDELNKMINNALTIKQYNIFIGLNLLWGFMINAILCIFFSHIFTQWNPFLVIIGYFILGIIGISMNKNTNNALVSFIGYNLVVLPIGIVLSIVLDDYYLPSIMQAFVLTTLFTIIMLVISTIKPNIFLNMGLTLCICLFAVVIIEIIMLIMGLTTPQWWDWLIALLFCGFIGYDWSKAQTKAKTLKNAVESALDLYLDIINIFIRLLKKKE